MLLCKGKNVSKTTAKGKGKGKQGNASTKGKTETPIAPVAPVETKGKETEAPLSPFRRVLKIVTGAGKKKTEEVVAVVVAPKKTREDAPTTVSGGTHYQIKQDDLTPEQWARVDSGAHALDLACEQLTAGKNKGKLATLKEIGELGTKIATAKKITPRGAWGNHAFARVTQGRWQQIGAQYCVAPHFVGGKK